MDNFALISVFRIVRALTNRKNTQEADSLYRSKAMPKVGDRGPRVLKVFPGVFIYIFAKKNFFCPKFLVQPG